MAAAVRQRRVRQRVRRCDSAGGRQTRPVLREPLELPDEVQRRLLFPRPRRRRVRARRREVVRLREKVVKRNHAVQRGFRGQGRSPRLKPRAPRGCRPPTAGTREHASKGARAPRSRPGGAKRASPGTTARPSRAVYIRLLEPSSSPTRKSPRRFRIRPARAWRPSRGRPRRAGRTCSSPSPPARTCSGSSPRTRGRRDTRTRRTR